MLCFAQNAAISFNLDIVNSIATIVLSIAAVTISFLQLRQVIKDRKEKRNTEQVKKDAIKALEKQLEIDEIIKNFDASLELLQEDLISIFSNFTIQGFQKAIERETEISAHINTIETKIIFIIEHNLLRNSCYFTTLQNQIVINIIKKLRKDGHNSYAEFNNEIESLVKNFNNLIPFFQNENIANEDKTARMEQLVEEYNNSIIKLNQCVAIFQHINEDIYLLRKTFDIGEVKNIGDSK